MEPYWRNLSYNYPSYDTWARPTWDWLNWQQPYVAEVLVETADPGALVKGGKCRDTTSADPDLVGNAFYAGRRCSELLSAPLPSTSQSLQTVQTMQSAQASQSSQPPAAAVQSSASGGSVITQPIVIVMAVAIPIIILLLIIVIRK